MALRTNKGLAGAAVNADGAGVWRRFATAMNPLRFLLIFLFMCFAPVCHAQINFGGEKAAEAQRLSQEANALLQKQRFGEAASLFRKLVALEAELYGDDARVLNGLRMLSYAYYKSAQYKESLAIDERRLRVAVKTLGERNPDSISALRDVAIAYENVFDDGYARALPLLEKALRLRTEVLGERHADTLSLLNDVANAFSFTGRHNEALALYERKLRIANAAYGPNHENTQSALLTVAIALSGLGRESEASAIFEKNLQFTIARKGEKSRDGIFAMIRLASSYSALGHYDKALPLAQKALSLRRGVFPEKDRETIHFIEVLAAIHMQLGQPGEALPLYLQAVKLYTEDRGGRAFTAMNATSQLARCYEALGRMDEALALHRRVLQINTEVQGAQHPDTIGALVNLARVERKLGHEAEAREHYAQVVPAVETLRINADLSPENRQALFSQWVSAYKAYAGLLVAAGKYAEAFRLAELSKARTLLESTAMRRANKSELLTDAERDSIQAFEARIAKFNDAIAGASQKPDQKLVLEADKNRVIVEFSALRRELARKYPKFGQLNEVKIVDAEEGRALLPSDALLVSYLLDGDRPIVFTMSGQNFDARLLDEFPKLANTAEAYRKLIAEPHGAEGLALNGESVRRLADGSYVLALGSEQASAPEVKDPEEIARYLSERLLAPIAERFAGRKRIIISADNALAMLPFETLPVAGRMLVADYDVSYTQSLSMFGLLKSRDEDYRRRDERKDLFAMGNPIYKSSGQPNRKSNASRNATTPRVDIGTMAKRNAGDPQGMKRLFDVLQLVWDNLPGAETEIANVASLFANERTTVFTRGDATEAKLLELNKRQVLRGYRYLLFSAHGFLSMEEPSLSALVLGQVDKAPGTDGYITAAEWPNYDLASDLVVLSACDTGVGKVVQGEGVMGLPYALFVAGNKNTMLSLWPVVDASTAEFMTAFFAKLRNGVTQSAALNETKREFIAGGRYGRAAYWAPFILYGF